MKKYVRKVWLICMLFIGVISLKAQLSQHGLVLNGGLGRVGSKSDQLGVRLDEIDYKVGLSLGYRFRFNKPASKTFHYDLDVNAGVKGARPTKWNIEEWTDEDGNTYTAAYGGSAGAAFYYTSLGFTANYLFFKNLSVGLGVEPAYHFKAAEIGNSFDIPVMAKIAYNLKVVEVGITGKYGLVNVFEMDYLKSGKVREIQLSLFIPFQTK